MVEVRRRNAEHSTLINETPGVSGGYPCVGDTRIRVALVVEAYRQIGSMRKTKTDAYPQLSHRQIRAAIDYYRRQPERVDEDIQRNREAFILLAPDTAATSADLPD